MGSPVTLKGQLVFPSKYLKWQDLPGGKDFAVTISAVSVDTLQMKGGVKEARPLVSFAGATKKLVMNKTNAATIAALYGNEMTTWIGKRITLFKGKDRFGRDMVDCIRIRPKAPSSTGVMEPPPESMQDENANAATDGEPVSFDPPAFGVPDSAMEAVK